MIHSTEFAYIVGMAIGDGNISNPNGRTYRLRISCDAKYPKIIESTKLSLQKVFPKNKISIISKKKTSFDVSVYNKNINSMFGWKLENGKKYKQKIIIPKWIDTDLSFIKYLIKGLFESDGSIYLDRKYLMANFVSYNKEIIDYLVKQIMNLSFSPTVSKFKEKNGYKYTLRISKNTEKFIEYFDIRKE